MNPLQIYTDRGLTGRTRAWAGLDQALAAVRAGDTLVVTKLDRLLERGVGLALGTTVYDPAEPIGDNVLQHPCDLRRV